MLGDADAGKTSLTIRYLTGFFLDDLKLTIGVDFFSKTTNYNEKKVKLQIWDFGGDERFRFLLHQYCKGANGAYFLYNIINPNSLDHLYNWTQIIREHAGDIPIMLVGTNSHSKELRAVTREQGIQATRIHNLAGFIEVSSKTGQNIEKLFDTMTGILFDRYRLGVISSNSSFPVNKVNKSVTYRFENTNSIKYVGKKIFKRFKSFLKKFLKFKLKKKDEEFKKRHKIKN